MAIDLVEVNDRPMTLIYPEQRHALPQLRASLVNQTVTTWLTTPVAADGTVRIRIPMMEFCQQLTYKLGRPIVSTSANISGEPTPKKFTDISERWKGRHYTVDPRLKPAPPA